MTTTIIILDDSAEFRKLMSKRLTSFIPDFSLVIFSSVAEARNGVRDNPALQPALVILDRGSIGRWSHMKAGALSSN